MISYVFVEYLYIEHFRQKQIIEIIFYSTTLLTHFISGYNAAGNIFYLEKGRKEMFYLTMH